MTGPHDGVIGVEKAAVIGQVPERRCRPASRPPAAIPGSTPWSITADPATGRATAIERLSHTADELAAHGGRAGGRTVAQP